MLYVVTIEELLPPRFTTTRVTSTPKELKLCNRQLHVCACVCLVGNVDSYWIEKGVGAEILL